MEMVDEASDSQTWSTRIEIENNCGYSPRQKEYSSNCSRWSHYQFIKYLDVPS